MVNIPGRSFEIHTRIPEYPAVTNATADTFGQVKTM
jgi:hypothetical protein